MLHLSICSKHTEHSNPPHHKLPSSTVPIQIQVKELEEIFLPKCWGICLSMLFFINQRRILKVNIFLPCVFFFMNPFIRLMKDHQVGKESSVPIWRLTPVKTAQDSVLPIGIQSSSLLIFSDPWLHPHPSPCSTPPYSSSYQIWR